MSEPDFAAARRQVPIDVDDPDAGAPASREVTPLDVIRGELAEEVDLGTVTLEVPGRPRYMVRYRCDVAYEELLDWRDRASITNRAQRRQKAPASAVAAAGRLNELKMAEFVLVYKADAILRDGDEVPDDDGGPLTFTSPLLLDMVGAHSATEAVRRFYGVDGHVTAAAQRVLVESGWTDAVLAGELEAPADPRKA